MGRFSKLERETQDALAKQQIEEKKAPEQPSAKVDSYDVAYYVKKGDDAFFCGQFREALQFYSRAIQTDNTRHYPWLGQIYCLIELGQLKEADIWASRALELFPEDGAILSLRAIMYANRGMYKRALNTSDYAISRKGADAHAFIARGHILLQADNKNAALCFMKAMEMAGPNEFETPMRIGSIYFKRKEYSLALDYFQKACALNISNDYLWFHLGMCYRKLGFQARALEAFQNALSMNPENKELQDAVALAAHSSLFYALYRKIAGLFK